MSSEIRPSPSLSIEESSSEVGRSAARYLFAVSKLSAGGTGRVTTGELREYLGVTPASVTEMVSKLDDRGLTDYEKYRGVRLTEHGEAFASRVAWRLCVVSTFFDAVVDADLDKRMAVAIAITLPQDGVFRLQDLVSVPCLGLCPEFGGEFDECVS
ncbi:MAG: metal-dependent transcriptional regulator [Haloarculaceae archaeon]